MDFNSDLTVRLNAEYNEILLALVAVSPVDTAARADG